MSTLTAGIWVPPAYTAVCIVNCRNAMQRVVAVSSSGTYWCSCDDYGRRRSSRYYGERTCKHIVMVKDPTKAPGSERAERAVATRNGITFPHQSRSYLEWQEDTSLRDLTQPTGIDGLTFRRANGLWQTVYGSVMTPALKRDIRAVLDLLLSLQANLQGQVSRMTQTNADYQKQIEQLEQRGLVAEQLVKDARLILPTLGQRAVKVGEQSGQPEKAEDQS